MGIRDVGRVASTELLFPWFLCFGSKQRKRELEDLTQLGFVCYVVTGVFISKVMPLGGEMKKVTIGAQNQEIISFTREPQGNY